MSSPPKLRAPFPWFGGKMHAAKYVWAALGAVLLAQPFDKRRTETVNDADELLVNAWRAIQLHPEETARAASWPVIEADLHARHLALVRWREDHELERLMADPEFCDPKLAGWWLWGCSARIGSGWCSGRGPWHIGYDGRLTKSSLPYWLRPAGVNRQKPRLTLDGNGVQRPGLRELTTRDPPPKLAQWLSDLSARLRYVRVLNGDWSRATTTGATITASVQLRHGTCGVFLDPPYGEAASRTGGLYAHDDEGVAAAVRAWCIDRSSDLRYRIVLAGFSGEHEKLTEFGWRRVKWSRRRFLSGGYGTGAASGHQQHREVLWLSPSCLDINKESYE